MAAPSSKEHGRPNAADVIVVGAGAAGLTAAIALAQQGFGVVVVGEIDTRPNARTVALLDGSVRLYQSLDLWKSLASFASPLATMRIIDDTDSLFRPPPVVFRAREIGLEAFGFNIENHALVATLAAVAAETCRLTLVEARATSFGFGADLATVALGDGRAWRAPLVAAADGRQSSVRAAAGIRVEETRHRQTALTAVVAHRFPHDDSSTEFHTRGGPFTLVPLRGKEGVPHRSSVVWMMPHREARRRDRLDDTALADDIERQSQSMLGSMRLDGPRGSFPLVSLRARSLIAQRLVLIGEAAHAFLPIGAQGLNIGLRDVAHLVDCLEAARARRADLGGAGLLATYAAARQADVFLRRAGVETLNRSLLKDALPIDFLRGAGLLALASVGPLRRAVMRRGIRPLAASPRLMRGKARPHGGA